MIWFAPGGSLGSSGATLTEAAANGVWRRTSQVLPETTEDESAIAWGDEAETDDERLLAERPPHWGSL